MPHPDSPAPAAPNPAPERLLSLDALRGFDMFWIVGADAIVEALLKISRTGPIAVLAAELDHAPWDGWTFEDMIFPLFVFLMGASIPLSLGRIAKAEGLRRAHMRLFRRAALILALGIFYYGGFAKPWPGMRLVGVLQRIGLCYLFAGLLYLNVGLRGMIAACVAFLVGYWALLSFVPAPGVGHVSFLPDQNWPNYIDLHYLPGRHWDKTWDPEGLLSTLPAISTALLGLFAGLFLQNKSIPDAKKPLWLMAAGVAGALLGFLWGFQFPIIKKLWTSSYVLLAGGYSAAMLGLFYLVVDVWKIRKWTAPFVWIGLNPLAIYMSVNILDFEKLALRFTGGDIQAAWGVYGDLLTTGAALGLVFLLAWYLQRRRIFLRV